MKENPRIEDQLKEAMLMRERKETKEEGFKEKLMNSALLAEAFIIIAHRTINQKERYITVNQVSKIMNKTKDHVRKYLELMREYDVLFISGFGNSTVKGKKKYYILNRNNEYYAQFIELAKKILGGLKESE